MLNYLDIVEAWEDWWEHDVERNEDKGYVGVRELSWGGQQGMVGYTWFVDVENCFAPSPDRHLVPHVMDTP